MRHHTDVYSLFASRLSRRSVVAGATLAALARRRAATAQEATAVATPATSLEGEADAVALLERAVAAVAALETFTFELQTVRGSSTIFQGFELKGVEGVVRRPLDIEATVTVDIPLGELTVTAVGLDGEFWVQDPLSQGEWIALGSDPQIQSLINPDALLLSAVRLVQDAEITGTEKVDGVDTTMVEGTVDFAGFIASVGGDTTMLEEFLAGEPNDVIFWIDDQDRVVEAEISGPIFRTESDDVVRALSLFDFDEPVEIERPEGV